MNYKTFKRLRKIFGKLALWQEEKILDKADDIKFYRSCLEDETNERLTKEYEEIRERAQYTGEHAVLSFDMKNSRAGYNYEVMKMLFDEYYKELKKFEEKWDTKIFHEPAEHSLPYENGYFQFGDQYAFPVEYNDDISVEFYTYVFSKVKKKLGVEYEFHYILLGYETDYYFEGDLKYYLMDAIRDAEVLSKKSGDLI